MRQERRIPVRTAIAALAVLGLAIRLVFAWQGDFTIHPDEVMQYLEQAHRLVFGYGYVPWEYRYGTRSWLLPGFIAGILGIARSLGLDSPPLYLKAVRLAFCLLSLAIPIGMYRYASRRFSPRAGAIAFVLGCFWYELAVFAHKPMPEFVATALLFGGLSLRNDRESAPRVWLMGIFPVLAVAVRLQYAPLAGLIWATTFAGIPRTRRSHLLASALLAAGLVGIFDDFTWGGWWACYLQNLRMNLGERVAAGFGVSPWYRYLTMLAQSTLGLFFVAGFAAVASPRRYAFPLAAIAAVVGTHSLISHKEYRFLFAAVPFWLIVSADLIDRAIAAWGSLAGRLRFAALAGWLLWASAAGFALRLPAQRLLYQTFGKPIASFLEKRDDLEALLYLHRLDGVTGVLDLETGHWSNFGGYTYLHRRVPLYDRSLYEKLLADKDLAGYVSHVAAPLGLRAIPGFRKIARIGGVQLWQRDPLGRPQKMWRYYTYSPVGKRKDEVAERYRVIFE